MATFCLIPKVADQFIEKIKRGEIDPVKLAEMSSEQRRKAFGFMGKENAVQVNRLFESKLILKNQQTGMISWAKKVGGLTKEARRDIISRIEKMDTILTPKDQQHFLEDLASHKLGATVTMKEAAQIAELSKNVTDTRVKVDETSKRGSESRMEYGRAQVELLNLVEQLKVETTKIKMADFKTDPMGTTGKAIVRTAGFIKSMKATLDNSVIGRQGWKVLFTHPTVWAKNSYQTFVDIAKVLGGKNALDEVRAEVLSRPNAMNGNYLKEKLAVGVKEEAYPTSLPGKIPGLGRVFKASEQAFTAFQYRTRADIFDRYHQIATKIGADPKGIGELANSLTGRGSWAGKSQLTNNVFFSPGLMKSHIDALTFGLSQRNLGSFARKRAAINSLKIITGIASILAVANAMNEDSVETDARSSDFGKIKVGNTRFDVSGGISGYATLAMRLMRQSSKSSTSGKITELNAKDKKGKPKFGAKTIKDVVYDFTENKTAPAVSVLLNIAEGQTFQGETPSPKTVARDLFVPIPITNYDELKNDPDAANKIWALIADGLGISTNTYK